MSSQPAGQARGTAVSVSQGARPARRHRPSKRSASEEVCPHYHSAVELIGRRWSGAIVYALTRAGPQRFADLKAAVPSVSDRLLSARLKELEDAGIVERTVEEGTPVRVTYGLTPKGESLEPVIGGLRDWARRWHRT